MWSKIVFCLMLAGLVSVECQHYQYLDDGLGDLSWYGRDVSWPLAVLSDRPYSFSHDTTRVPLLAVPTHEMALLSKPHVSSYSPDSNLVTCQLNKFSMEAMPAVKIILPMPVLLSGEEGSLNFPSHLSVETHGIRFVMPVGALLAPVPDHSYSSQHILNVVYAVPSFGYREPLPYPHYPTYVPVSYPRPNGVTIKDENRITTPITVLEFPTKISTPAALERPYSHYDEELVNRGPPQEVVIPAGVVQSTQPQSLLTTFINSKESPLLQAFRDEANKHKDYTGKPAVEAL